MDPAGALRWARRKAQLTQRELARRCGVSQPVIARIESGGVVPRVDTLDRLLAGCGFVLEVEPRPGIGVDRTLIEDRLKRTPRERIEDVAYASERLKEFLARAKRVG